MFKAFFLSYGISQGIRDGYAHSKACLSDIAIRAYGPAPASVVEGVLSLTPLFSFIVLFYSHSLMGAYFQRESRKKRARETRRRWRHANSGPARRSF